MLRRVKISGTGRYLPANVLTNADIAARGVDTSDDWIVQRTGIRERRIAGDGELTSHMCREAALQALAAAGITGSDLDLIIVGTVSPDMPMPSTACFLQAALGAERAGAFDISAACSGFLYGLAMARNAVACGSVKYALVVGAESLSRFLNFEDRSSCILFGDGAGAVVIEASDNESDILHTFIGADGTQAETLWIPGGGSRWPTSSETIARHMHAIALDGRAIYKFAVKKFVDLIEGAAQAVGIKVQDIDFIVPHQVNMRIIESSLEKLAFPLERTIVNIDRYGNTSAASVPIALDESVRSGRIRRGDIVVMVAFGAGLTWASAAIRW